MVTPTSEIEDIAILQKILHFLHPVPPKAKIFVGLSSLGATGSCCRNQQYYSWAAIDTSASVSSLSIVASKTAVWQYDKNEDAFSTLAGSVEEGVAGVQDGLRSQARFDFISDIVTN